MLSSESLPSSGRGVKRSRLQSEEQRRNYSPSAIVDITACDDEDDVIPLLVSSSSSSSNSSSTPAFLHPSTSSTPSSSSTNVKPQQSAITTISTKVTLPTPTSSNPPRSSRAEVVDLSLEDEVEDDATLQQQMSTYFRQQREDEEAAEDAAHEHSVAWWQSELDAVGATDDAFAFGEDEDARDNLYRDAPPFIRNYQHQQEQQHWVDAQRERAKRARIQTSTDPATLPTSPTGAAAASSSSIWAAAAAATIPSPPAAAAAAMSIAASSSQVTSLSIFNSHVPMPASSSFNRAPASVPGAAAVDSNEMFRRAASAMLSSGIHALTRPSISRPPPPQAPPVPIRMQVRPCPHNPPCPQLHFAPMLSGPMQATVAPSNAHPRLLPAQMNGAARLSDSDEDDEDFFVDSDEEEDDEEYDEDDEDEDEDGLDPQRTSLSRAEVDQFPTSIITEKDVARNDECCVCLSGYEVGESVRRLTCLHLMHSACIDQWLQRSTCCPLCKESLLYVR